MQPLKNGYFLQFLALTRVSDFKETWGFLVDDPYDLPDSSILSADKFTKPNITKPLQISDFWAYLSFGT